MRKIIDLTCIDANKKTAVALGYFDGVHMGHRAVLTACTNTAKQKNINSAVFTFNLPQELAHVKGSKILSDIENETRIKNLGLQYYYCPEFNTFKNLSPKQFVQKILAENMNASEVFCGENFTFGKGKSGDITLLTKLCAQQNIAVTIIPTQKYNGKTVSSTRIKECLANGDVKSVNAMLCTPYTVDFNVIHGKKIGGTLGYPTVNQVYPECMTQPKSGVYITSAVINGKKYAAATGLGNRPTFNGTHVTCETFIIDFNEQIYGENVEITFHEYLKPTTKFENKDELVQYIESAVNCSREYHAKSNTSNGGKNEQN